MLRDATLNDLVRARSTRAAREGRPELERRLAACRVILRDSESPCMKAMLADIAASRHNREQALVSRAPTLANQDDIHRGWIQACLAFEGWLSGVEAEAENLAAQLKITEGDTDGGNRASR